MSCLTEERLVEMMDGGGLDSATRPEEEHLEACEACQEAWGSVAAAGEVLAAGRSSRIGRLGWALPIVAAAGLLAIVGLVLGRPGGEGRGKPVVRTVEELARDLVEGTEEESRAAREHLSARGEEAVASLVACRSRHRGSPRLRLLQDQIFALKRARHADDPEKLAVLRKLETTKVDMRFVSTQLGDVVDFMRDLSGLNLVLDPGLPAGSPVVELDAKETSFREILDLVCTVRDLDFDLRYGVVWISAPRRLWLGPGGDAAGVLPLNNRWAEQLLEGEDGAVADKLRAIRMNFELTGAPLAAVLAYLREISGLRIEAGAEVPDRSFSLRVTDVRMENVLELLTIPVGLDARIEGGVVRLVPSR